MNSTNVLNEFKVTIFYLPPTTEPMHSAFQTIEFVVEVNKYRFIKRLLIVSIHIAFMVHHRTKEGYFFKKKKKK